MTGFEPRTSDVRSEALPTEQQPLPFIYFFDVDI